MYYHSRSTGGCYVKSVHGGNMPSDAFQISLSEFNMIKNRSNENPDKELSYNDDGRPILVKIAPIQRRASVKKTIDTAAGNARARYVSAGQLVEEEYRLALQQTQDWRAAGSPADAVPASIQDWADADDITAEESATSIEQTAAGWETVLLIVRQLRLAGKSAVDASDDTADFDAVAKVYIDQLDAMKP